MASPSSTMFATQEAVPRWPKSRMLFSKADGLKFSLFVVGEDMLLKTYTVSNMSTVLGLSEEYSDEYSGTYGGCSLTPSASILLKMKLMNGAGDDDDHDAVLLDEPLDLYFV